MTLQLPRRWADGTTAVVLDPLDFLSRLAAIVPRPGINTIRYHGVLAPNAAWRPLRCHQEGSMVGEIHAAKYGSRYEAVVPIDHAIREYIGDLGEGVARGLLLRHDHGPRYTSNAFLDHLKFLGIESSPSHVRAPEGNGVIERFMRTLKEQLLWGETYDSEEDLGLALAHFRRIYNDEWIMERHGYRTPSEARADFVARAQRAA